jgi:hypothetical protein
MGSSGDKPRKVRRRMAKVPRGAEPNDIHLAGLTNSAGGTYGSRVDHEASGSRSEDLGRFGKFFLWLLGRRPKDPSTSDGHTP